GGSHWSQLANTANPNFDYVSDIIVSPTDPQRIYSATAAGVFRSLDGGTTWTNSLSNSKAPEGCNDLAIRTDQSSDYIFAACGVFLEGDIFRNTAAETSNPWDLVNSNANAGITTLAIAPSNQDIVYALAASNSKQLAPYDNSLAFVW